MKRYNIYFMAGLMIFTVISACKKVSKIHPYDAIDQGSAFASISDASKWDAGTYSNFRGAQALASAVTDIQADQLNITSDNGNNNTDVYKWGAFLQAGDVSGTWNNYSNILQLNIAIAGFKTIKTSSAADAAKLNQYTGDLYLARAFYYHSLILRYGKAYDDDASAAANPGVPLVLTYDVNALPARASVKAIYDQMLSDINTAKGLLANVAGTPGANTFNIDVATALEARVRLHMHDYAGAYAAATKLIGSGTYPLVSNLADLQNYWYNDGVQEDIYQCFASVSELNGGNSTFLNYLNATKAYDPSYVPTKTVIGMYNNADIRKATYFANLNVSINSVKTNLNLINKYPGNPAFNTAGAISKYVNASKVFRIGEMYLIAAEAADGKKDPGNAAKYLNLLHAARVGGSTINATGTALTDSIRSERTRELAFEGFRLDDLKRWHLGFTRGAPQNKDVLIPQGIDLTIAPDDNKFVWAIPPYDLTLNKNLTQNPGW
ncbi:RagB/SusD family nutrient uptake outer membrane protein [Mucilaginibacter sp. BJC16-A38]|uniref:RagB/SusD family nutrient uptake outer membrane protein n=1 Tax=Mucilaginibacter phenanthrenivorans TaxID=1234842 RepID=UPI0021575494|nr:RagB/SusD family nutrient uptake outer membrane protein [Mucilaginibacter phenanthrenivorans]MCR8561596.1 RagB/SusD family nutrient uptake outer membrane protein [Mucilaginibacter phenanthrenivorans]